MRAGLAEGDHAEISITVDESMRASLLGKPVHPLYGTAAMIEHMEWAARQHILPYLEPGEEGVGYHVNVKHLAPAPMGAEIKIYSTVTEIAPRRITSRVEAQWNGTLIGEGQIVQALVQLDKFYPSGKPATDSRSGQGDEQVPVPPPAVLVSRNGQERLQVEVLQWETSLFACTRYDEWLICRVQLQTPEAQHTHKGAFLLRYEIEEWMDAVQAMVQNQRSAFASDFLEPVLKVQIAEGEVGEWACTFQLTPPEQVTQRLSLIADPAALKQFGHALAEQLEGFPSQL